MENDRKFKCQIHADQKIDIPGFIWSGKSGKKKPFTQGVMESWGKSGNLKIFA